MQSKSTRNFFKTKFHEMLIIFHSVRYRISCEGAFSVYASKRPIHGTPCIGFSVPPCLIQKTYYTIPRLYERWARNASSSGEACDSIHLPSKRWTQTILCLQKPCHTIHNFRKKALQHATVCKSHVTQYITFVKKKS